MYADDSFYTLTLFGRLGVIAISGLAFLLLSAVAVLLMKDRRGAVRLAMAAFLFAIFVWLMPQVYYTFYGLIFDDVPRQMVIGAPPPFDMLLGLITFSGPSNLSAHSQGVLFWALVWFAWRLRSQAPVALAPDP